MESSTAPDIFLSYAHEDRKLAKRLATALMASEGWSVWWDPKLRSGERFDQEITRVVAASRCVVVLWSAAATTSNWVVAEASEGWERGVLVPVLVEDCNPPLPFRQLQAADLVNWNGSSGAPTLLALIQDLQRVMARGSAVSPEDLSAREARRQRLRRQRWLRRVAAVTAACALVITAWYGLQWRSHSTLADSVASHSEAIRAGLLRAHAESNLTWWAFIMYDRQTQQQLETSALLAVEAAILADTPNTRAAVAGAWSLLPTSDLQQTFDANQLHSALAFSFDGQLVAAGGGAGDSVIWDLESNAIIANIAHGGLAAVGGPAGAFEFRPGHVLDFSPSERVLATGGPDTTVRLWTEHGVEQARFLHPAAVTEVRFAPTGTLLAATDEAGGVVLWDIRSGNAVHRMTGAKGAARLPVFSPQGTFLAAAGPRDSATIWEVASGKKIASIDHRADWGEDELDGLAFSADQTMLVSFADQRATIFHEVTTGRELWRIEEGSSSGPVFSADSSTAIIGGDQLSWWDLQTHQPRFSIATATIQSIAASPDHHYVATADTFATVQVWNMAAGIELKRVPFYRWKTALAFAPDGSSLAYSGFDELLDQQVLAVVKLRPAPTVASICAEMSRNLSRSEWREYFAEAPYRATCPQPPASDSQPVRPGAP